MSDVVITHPDSTTTTYANCMAGVANNQGNGWKLSIIPTDPTVFPFVYDLLHGDTYQTTGALPDAGTMAASALAEVTTQATAASPDAAYQSAAAAETIIKNVESSGTTETVP